MDPAGAVVVTVGLCLVAPLAWLMVRSAGQGGIEMNGLVGIRTRATRASPEAWRAGHAAALPWTTRAALVGVGIGVVGTLLSLLVDDATWRGILSWAGFVGLLVFVTGLLLATRAADRAARAVDERR